MTSALHLHECPESAVGRSVTLQFERFARPTGVYPEQPRTRETPHWREALPRQPAASRDARIQARCRL